MLFSLIPSHLWCVNNVGCTKLVAEDIGEKDYSNLWNEITEFIIGKNGNPNSTCILSKSPSTVNYSLYYLFQQSGTCMFYCIQ